MKLYSIGRECTINWEGLMALSNLPCLEQKVIIWGYNEDNKKVTEAIFFEGAIKGLLYTKKYPLVDLKYLIMDEKTFEAEANKRLTEKEKQVALSSAQKLAIVKTFYDTIKTIKEGKEGDDIYVIKQDI